MNGNMSIRGIFILLMIILIGCSAEKDTSDVLISTSDFPDNWEWINEGRDEIGEDVFLGTKQSYEWRARRLIGSPSDQKWLINIVHRINISNDIKLLDKLELDIVSSWDSNNIDTYELNMSAFGENAEWACRVEETILSSCKVLIRHPEFISIVAFYFPTNSETDFVESMIENVIIKIEERANKLPILTDKSSS
jgi:hypothetical protein